ncbi:hypothetical protein EON63_20185, partial [archaeon]
MCLKTPYTLLHHYFHPHLHLFQEGVGEEGVDVGAALFEESRRLHQNTQASERKGGGGGDGFAHVRR